jgi:hypothetical protein
MIGETPHNTMFEPATYRQPFFSLIHRLKSMWIYNAAHAGEMASFFLFDMSSSEYKTASSLLHTETMMAHFTDLLEGIGDCFIGSVFEPG